MLESQRPMQFILFKVASATFGSFALAYQILNLLSTSLLILVVFKITEFLFRDLFEDSSFYAFLTASLICISFNIDELYSWGSIFPITVAFLLYLSTFYFYIRAYQNRIYLLLSVSTFFIAVFIYELGIFIPVICFTYDLIFHRNWKQSLAFIIPLGVYGIIRETRWFGLGWNTQNRDVVINSPLFFQKFFDNILHNFIREIGLTGLNVYYGISGLLTLNVMILGILILIDAVCIFLIVKYLVLPGLLQKPGPNYSRNAAGLCLIGILGFILCHLEISLSGNAETRHLFFIDFFIAIILVTLCGRFIIKNTTVIPLFCIVLICVLINQGLCVNWVIAGDICASVNQSISENAENISSSEYLFIDAPDLFRAKPNAALKSTLINDQYNVYLGTPCLPDWAVTAMLSGAGIDTSRIHLIYGNAVDGKPAEVTIAVENRSISYMDDTTDTRKLVTNTEYFELNSSNLLAHYHENR